MAIVVPIAAEWNPQGVKKATADLDQAQGKWAKAGVAAKKAFLPAAAVLGGFAAAGVTFAKKAEEAATATARLNTTLGNVKGVPQEAIDRQQQLAKDISKVAAVSDEEIKAGQAILATFQKVGATAEDTGGSFDRATQAAVDLAAAGFGSIDTNAKQLGKALEDPEKGITALKKAGVSFTKQQQDQIKTWAKSGKLAEAQNAILQEVEKQVGGTAEATANSSDKMAVAWEDAQQSLGEVLLPVVDKGAALLQKFADFAEKNKTAVVVLAGVIAGLAGAIVAINIAMKIWQAGVAAATAIQWAWNAAMAANPIGLIVIAIAALVAAFVVAYKKSETFRNIVDTALAGVRKAFKWLADKAGAALQWIRDNWDTIVTVLKNSPIGLYIRAVMAVFTWLKDKLGPWFRWIKEKWDKLIELFGRLKKWFDENKQKIITAVTAPFIAAFNLISKAWNNTVGGLTFKIPEWFALLSPAAALLAGREFSIPRAPELAAPGRAPNGGVGAIARQTVNIYGAIDPAGTAAQVAAIQQGRVNTIGRTSLVPVF